MSLLKSVLKQQAAVPPPLLSETSLPPISDSTPISPFEYFKTSTYLETERGRFHIYHSHDLAEGPQRPSTVLFLIHGAGHTGASWSLAVQHLHKRALIIAPDLRGHGGTACDDGTDFSLPTLVADCECIIKTIFGSSVEPSNAATEAAAVSPLGFVSPSPLSSPASSPFLSHPLVPSPLLPSILHSASPPPPLSPSFPYISPPPSSLSSPLPSPFSTSSSSTISSSSSSPSLSTHSSSLTAPSPSSPFPLPFAFPPALEPFQSSPSIEVSSFPSSSSLSSTNSSSTSSSSSSSSSLNVESYDRSSSASLNISLIVIGHSMGACVAVHLAAKKTLAIKGLAVIDAVEGSAMESFSKIRAILMSRPSSFSSPAEGIRWAVKAQMLKSIAAARVSIPPQLVEAEPSAGQGQHWKWRVDLLPTEVFWAEWYRGLSKLFIQTAPHKLLILAGTDRLDKELLIGQMQGKFQVVILSEAGHCVQEDQPLHTANYILSFLDRYQF